jgi:hypothetical protein
MPKHKPSGVQDQTYNQQTADSSDHATMCSKPTPAGYKERRISVLNHRDDCDFLVLRTLGDSSLGTRILYI